MNRLDNLGELLRTLSKSLPGESPALDAQVLLAHILGKPRSWILGHPEAKLSSNEKDSLDDAAMRVRQGEPLPYVLGHWEFFGLDLIVTPDVLIPRPETELLVETALDWLGHHPNCANILDVGTGSGCIAIALAYKLPRLSIRATDISTSALEVARKNAARCSVQDKISFVEADLLPEGSHPSEFDLVLANLPYIPTKTLHELPIHGREPTLALDGGPDGLDLVKRLIHLLKGKLHPKSLVLMEIEHRQGEAVSAFAKKAFPAATVEIIRDLAGLDRLLLIHT